MSKDMMIVKDLIGKMISSKENYIKIYDGITKEVIYYGTDRNLFRAYEKAQKEVISFHVEDLGHGMVLMQNIE